MDLWQAEANKLQQARSILVQSSLRNAAATGAALEAGLGQDQVKRINCVRLSKTAQDLAGQPVWSSGLGIWNHHAALKPDLVQELDRATLASQNRELFVYDPTIVPNPPKLPSFSRSCLWHNAGVCQMDVASEGVSLHWAVRPDPTAQAAGEHTRSGACEERRLGGRALVVPRLRVPTPCDACISAAVAAAGK